MGGLHQFARPLWPCIEVVSLVAVLEELLAKDWRGEEPLDGHRDVRRLATVASSCVGDLVDDSSRPLREGEAVGNRSLWHYRSPTPNQPAPGLHLVHTLPISAELSTCLVIDLHDSQYCHIRFPPNSLDIGTKPSCTHLIVAGPQPS